MDLRYTNITEEHKYVKHVMDLRYANIIEENQHVKTAKVIVVVIIIRRHVIVHIVMDQGHAKLMGHLLIQDAGH